MWMGPAVVEADVDCAVLRIDCVRDDDDGAPFAAYACDATA